MIALFTDFGLDGPYTGQMLAVLHRQCPQVPVVSLFADAPAWDPQASAYLLAAYALACPRGTVLLCVIDPGVGGDRDACVVAADGRWYVAPDNGLLEVVVRRSRDVRCWRVAWRPERLSASFHGRDLFAPVAASVLRGTPLAMQPVPVMQLRRKTWPDDLRKIIYIDKYGNAMTGVRAGELEPRHTLIVGGKPVRWGRTFSDVPEGEALWYENANGLAEVAINSGNAATTLGIAVGTEILVGV